MEWLNPHETELRGGWVARGASWVADDTCRRIWELVERRLELIARQPGGWDALYLDPADGRWWELLHPASPGREGEPPVLRHVTREEARPKYAGAPTAPARPAPGLSKGLLVFATVAYKVGLIAGLMALSVGYHWWEGSWAHRLELGKDAIVSKRLGLHLPFPESWSAAERTGEHEVTLRRAEPAATFQLIARDADDGRLPDAGIDPGAWTIHFDGDVREVIAVDEQLHDRRARRVRFDVVDDEKLLRYRVQTVAVRGSVLVFLCSAKASDFALAEAACDELLRELRLPAEG